MLVRKILIVDDEKMMLRIATRILSKDYETFCASSGAEAIDLFEQQHPDMVLSDLMMPEMDGYELHRELQDRSLEPVPVMFMTADESDESESRSFEVGAMDYIRKPLKPEILLRRVKNVIDNLDKIHALKKAVDVDLMTGLLNKAASQREIAKLCETREGVLMMLDLDSFKLVNDIYGHNMGDKILIHFSELIKRVIRSSDLAGRMGGDEFIAFCHNIQDESVVVEKTKYLNDELLLAAKKFMGDDMQIPLGTSIGVVFVPNEGTSFSALYQKADQALYNVKQRGKHGCAFFGESKKSAAASDTKNNLSEIKTILGERNKIPGAYAVDFNGFQLLYRHLIRMRENHPTENQILQITIESEQFSEEFRETLIHSLRRSDCMTQNAPDQFLVLLMDATPEICEKVEQRIKDRIKFKIDIKSESIS